MSTLREVRRKFYFPIPLCAGAGRMAEVDLTLIDERDRGREMDKETGR